nr:MAG TPA: protein of unknown function (DUF4177) [Caudoviricetes sp.]
MKYEYAIINVNHFAFTEDVEEKLDSYGKWGYKVVGVYPSRDKRGFENWSIILMAEVE